MSETMQMNKLVQLRGRLKVSITKACQFAEGSQEGISIEQIVLRLNRLEEVWKAFMETATNLYDYSELDDYVDPNADFYVYEEKYLLARGKLLEIRNTLQPPRNIAGELEAVSQLAQQQSQVLQQLTASGENATELPKINITPFSGSYKDWPSFKDIFVSTIDSKKNLTKTKKFHYLKSFLRDEAARLVQHIAVTESAYTKAWLRLNERYDRPRHIVNSFIDSFMNLPLANSENVTTLRNLSDGANEIIRGLDAIGKNDRDCWLIHILLAKLDSETKSKWIHDSKDNAMPGIEDFFEFLDSRCEELELCQQKPQYSKKSKSQHNHSTKSFVSTDTTNKICMRCKSTEHTLGKMCSQFMESTVNERRDFVKQQKLCYNCLKNGHTSYNCKSKFRCNECHKRHHTLVHPLESAAVPSSTNNITSTNPMVSGTQWSTVSHVSATGGTTPYSDIVSQSNHVQLQNQPHSILPTALVNVKDVSGKFIACRVLLDTASELSYISEKCIRRLGIKRQRSCMVVSGISSVQAASTRGLCQISVKSRVSEDEIDAEVHVLPKITSLLPAFPFESYIEVRNESLADPSFNIPAEIDILLGTQYVWNILTYKKLFDKSGNPIAISTIFGWVITKVEFCTPRQTNSFCSIIDIDKSLKEFWEIEELNIQPALDEDSEFAEKHFCETHRRHTDGKYSVELPFKKPDVRFSNTFHGALQRFYSVERRLQRDSTLREKYVQFMRDYKNLGHMRALNHNEIDVADGKVFYMPHHPVVGEKLRVVFDGSYKDTNGTSLNSVLHVGPSIQRDLLSVCLRFRFHRYVFSADIVQMFRQIWVETSHRNFQRIIWRDSPKDRLQHFQLCTVTYGTACAPFLSVRVLKQLAEDYSHAYPTAARILLNDFYVDDVITGADTEEEILKLKDDLVNLLSCAKLELRKWVSNCQALVGNSSEHLLFKSPDTVWKKVLGVYWRPDDDVLTYKLALQDNVPCTKRQVLSDVSKIFDPMGLLAPVVINFKILFQDLWLRNLSWDEPLPRDVAEKWLTYRDDLKQVQNLNISRLVISGSTLELHGFSDASIKAYSAAVYARSFDSSGVPNVTLVAAKTRVAPLKQISLSRLELMGAVLLSRLLKRISTSIEHQSVVIRAWCDSTIVLSWLSHQPTKLKTYVANRTAEILETLPRNVWNHVRSPDNPADCASRGLLASKLVDFNLWWKGPAWLEKSDDYARMLSSSVDEDVTLKPEAQLEVKSVTYIITSQEDDNVISSLVRNTSNWVKLIRIVAFVLRFVHNTRNPESKTRDSLRFEEITQSKIFLLQFSQNSFKDEMAQLKICQYVNIKSKLFKLNPYLCTDGLIRVGGRLRNSQLDIAIQHPIILDKQCRITQLILEYEHMKHCHPGVSALFVIVRQHYWILGARNLIRKLTHKCLKCFRQRQLSMQQMMADLPAVRSRQAFPFEHSGCDYAGPITLKLHPGKRSPLTKGYICVFVCMVTSAIHIELVTDLSTECFLAALRRFISRRGKCKQIYSDNGKNFLGASRALNEMHQVLMSQSHNDLISESLAEDGIRWNFIPPRSPHWGGMWESAVRSIKLHLKRVISNCILTVEQMNTLLVQIEGIVNSRPLGQASDTECEYLSPAHFLIGRPITMVPEGDVTTINVNRLSYWQHIQNMVQGFWKKWHEEYLTSLQNRPKWNTIQKNIEIGNIVVLKDNKTPPATWPLGKIIEVYPGSDGLVRVAKIKTKNGETTRSIAKLVVLPVF